MKKLYLSDHNKKIAGVCGGLADYFGIDPTILRVAWFVASMCYGVELPLYIGFWICVPRENDGGTASREVCVPLLEPCHAEQNPHDG